MNLQDGDTMVAAAENAGLKIAVSHQQVYQPATQKTKCLLDEGRIGQVHSIYTHGKQDHRGGGEDMIVLGTHTFNMMPVNHCDFVLSSMVPSSMRSASVDDYCLERYIRFGANKMLKLLQMG